MAIDTATTCATAPTPPPPCRATKQQMFVSFCAGVGLGMAFTVFWRMYVHARGEAAVRILEGGKGVN